MKYKDLEKEWSQYWFQYIKDHPDKPWNWKSLSSNLNITWEIIQQNPDKPWDWMWLSNNPNITWEIIQSNPDKPWDWRYISCNDMWLWKKQWITKIRLKHIKASQIQRHWRNCSCNPEYKLAKRCLLRLHRS